MFIDTSGNVGIGSAWPSAKLHVVGNVYIEAGQPGITLKATSGTQQRWINWVSDGGNYYIYNESAGANIVSVASNGYFTVNVLCSYNYPCSSDLVFKKNINPIEKALDKVLKLKGVSYEWKVDEYKNRGFTEGKHYGVIAQELEKTIPELVKGTEGDKYVLYVEMIPLLIEAVKEQQKTIESQQKEIYEYKKGMDDLSARVQKLEAKDIRAQAQ